MKSLTDIEYLLECIERIDRISDDELMSTLNDRKIKELEFHDKDRDKSMVEKVKASDSYEKFYGNKKYYATVRRSRNYVKNWIKKESVGKVFLDYACGNGANALLAASSGAALSLGFDISSVSVENAKAAAIESGVEVFTRFFQADAENTKLPDDSIDVIVCSGMLHHLDLSYALPELRRILKPGGKIMAVEALDYNPFIKLYRIMTPAMRTDWEKAHILDLSDVRFATRFLALHKVHYWHVLGYIGGKIPALFPLLDALDIFLEKIPFIQQMAWMFTFELHKKLD